MPPDTLVEPPRDPSRSSQALMALLATARIRSFRWRSFFAQPSRHPLPKPRLQAGRG